MALHVFGAIITGFGVAANNRGETEGNITTLQKLLWRNAVHTTVSAEAIRFAIRRRLAEGDDKCNRTYSDDESKNEWADPGFKKWLSGSAEESYIDDDLLGFMSADAAKEENTKGAKVRRAVLEITRAISLTPWSGDVTFNAASIGATPSAQKKGSNPVPYGTEMHATRYQYGFALTPERLRVPERSKTAIRALCDLGAIAGNNGRFLFDFSPDAIVLRVTHDPAPRLLYGFGIEHDRVTMPDILRKIRAGDIAANELIIGGSAAISLADADRALLNNAAITEGIKQACEAVCVHLESVKVSA
ncbi:MAG: type I-B CRISPR-associated protein Cas7/Cst2/DevR [Cyanobacteria bacterium NC_groundwater_1444_Ag_S-0.65um_54_12]|nr:type I-B CRISPR-associated protein Cas7/Cst2/DevR [Cyanobacteria bacterium NC_groundwater_1444_Ag_S-0.65um_54_12]